MRALFSIIKGKDHGKSFYVTEGKPLTLGRSSAADIALSEPRISRIHCRFTHDGKHIMLTDLNSTNGTYVNERKIKSVPLTDQDSIRIGETVITMRLESGAEAEAKPGAKEPERPKAGRADASAKRPAPQEAPEAATRPPKPSPKMEEEPPPQDTTRRPQPPTPRKPAESEGSVMGLFDKWLDEPQKRPTEKRASEPPTRARAEKPAAERPPAPSPGTLTLPGIEVQKKVGEDALGEIYRGAHAFLARPVSVRVLSGAAVQDRTRSKEFIEMARANARLNHPNIAQIYGGGKSGDTYYLVSEVPEGLTLDALMAREGRKRPLNVNLALEIALQLARALRRAHAEKLVHWDLRPETISISRERVAKIGGFNFPGTLARIAMGAGEMTSRLPVHPYMAPEIIHDLNIADFRADIYGVAAVLYDMVGGRAPFHAESERELMDAILRHRPETPQEHNAKLSPELCLLILKGLAKDPANRYATAADLVKELKALPQPKASGEEE